MTSNADSALDATASLDETSRWMLWDLFLRTGTAELFDAEIPGVDLVPAYPTKQVGSSKLAIGRVVRFGLDKIATSGLTPMIMISQHVNPGDVVAIDSGGGDIAVMGGRLASRAIVKGACAVVTDGRLRDANEFGRLPIAAWANAGTPSGGTEPGTYRLITGASKLFGLEWADGDWYAHDDDGALRISASGLVQVLEQFGREFKK
jgi:regulator of RNase E activity RraA